MTAVVMLALLGAACYGVASVLQHQATETQTPELVAMQAGAFVQLARHPRWLLGNALDVAGFTFQLLALRRGPLTLVEPLLVASLLFAFPVGALVHHRKVSMNELIAAAVVAAGLGLFLAIARPGPSNPTPQAAGLVALTVLTAAAVGTSVLAARRSARNRAGLLLAGGGGIAFGYMAATTSLTWRVLDHGVLHALASWEPYAVVVSGVGGILLTQSAFAAGVLRLSLPTLTVVQPLVAIAIGLLLLGERINSHGVAPLWEALGLATVVVGIFALAQPEFPE
jgi:drug/metabolite transporter (DMT)-like permease